MQFNQAPAPRESSLSDAYDPTASYSVDDLCIHDNVLYKCIVPISGGEAWNSAHWTETNIGDEISALNSELTNVETADIASTVPNPNGDEQTAVKCGKVVTVTIGAGTVTTRQAIATLPIGFRPSTQRYIRFGGVATQNGTSWEPVAVQVDTNGNIIVFPLVATTYSIVRVYIAFII